VKQKYLALIPTSNPVMFIFRLQDTATAAGVTGNTQKRKKEEG
jgi:hypothetical protein